MRRAFTLIELLVVVVVIVTLMAITFRLGSIGSETRMKYDMIGRNVNLASRVQGCTAGGQILVTTEHLKAAGDLVHVNEAGTMWVKPKGIREEIQLHDVVGYGTHWL